MQFALGKVIDGRVVIEGDSPAEGSTVAVLYGGPPDGATLDAERQRELQEAIGGIARGEFVSLDQLLESLPKST